MARQDILLDNDDELQIANGDFVVGGSADQEVWLIVRMEKGEMRQWPTIGFAINKRIKKRVGNVPFLENVPRFKRDLKVELESDAHFNPDITVNETLSEFKILVQP